jgi:hypothetical protein
LAIGDFNQEFSGIILLYRLAVVSNVKDVLRARHPVTDQEAKPKRRLPRLSAWTGQAIGNKQ